MKALPDSDCPHPSNPSFRSQLTRWSHMLTCSHGGGQRAQRGRRGACRDAARQLPRLQQDLSAWELGQTRMQNSAVGSVGCRCCFVFLAARQKVSAFETRLPFQTGIHPFPRRPRQARGQTGLRLACSDCSRRHGKSQPARNSGPQRKKAAIYLRLPLVNTAALILPTLAIPQISAGVTKKQAETRLRRRSQTLRRSSPSMSAVRPNGGVDCRHTPSPRCRT